MQGIRKNQQRVGTIGLPDKRCGERVKSFVVLRDQEMVAARV